MKTPISFRSALLLAGAAVFSLLGTVAAADAQMRTQTQDRIYGSQMMTEQERDQYRNRMHSAETVQERDRIRAEHHEQMQQRATERGMTLPDEPPARGMGQGSGSGQGMGAGRGAGSGMGGGMGPGGSGRR